MSRSAGVAAWTAVTLILVALGWPAVNGGLIRDDVLYTTGNPHVTEPVGFGTMLGSPLWPYEEVGLYRPLTTWSFRLDWLISDAFDVPFTTQTAPVSHVHNLALNAIAAVLFGLLLRRLGFSASLATAGALLFGAHPARSEAFLWISGRAECLMTVFALGTLLVTARGRLGWIGLVACASGAAAAFLSKEQGITLLVLAPLLPGLASRDRIRAACAVGVGVAPVLIARYDVLGSLGPTGVQQVLLGASFFEMMGHALRWLGMYVQLLVMPWPLLHEYSEPTGSDPLAVGTAVVALLVGAVLILRIRGRWGFAASWFLVTIAPTLNLVHRSSEVFAERFLALPAGGFIILFLLALRRGRGRGAVVATLLLAAGSGIATWTRAADYVSQKAIFDAQRRDAWYDGAAHALQGQLAMAEGRYEDAVAALTRASEHHDPGNVVWRLALARALIARTAIAGTGDDAAPRAILTELTSAYPELAPAWVELGNLERRARRHQHAAVAYRQALLAEPRTFPAASALAALLRAGGNHAEARAVLERVTAALDEAAVDRPWDFQPLTLAGRALAEAGHHGRAVLTLERSLQRALRAEDVAGIAQVIDHVLTQARRPAAERNARLVELIARLRSHLDTSRPQDRVMLALADVCRLRGDSAGESRWLQGVEEITREPAIRERVRQRLRR